MKNEDLKIIKQAKRGDPLAFERIIRNYQDFVFRTAFGITQNQFDAKDVTQETFIKVYRSLAKLHDEHSFPAWIAKITIRTAFDWLEKQTRHIPTEIDLLSAVIKEEDNTHLIEFGIDLRRALIKLSPEHRAILLLRDVQGYNYREIANLLEIPEGTVRSRIHHARTQLRQELADLKGQ